MEGISEVRHSLAVGSNSDKYLCKSALALLMCKNGFCSLMQSVASGKGTAGMRQRERLVGSIPTCTTKRDLFTYC